MILVKIKESFHLIICLRRGQCPYDSFHFGRDLQDESGKGSGGRGVSHPPFVMQI